MAAAQTNKSTAQRGRPRSRASLLWWWYAGQPLTATRPTPAWTFRTEQRTNHTRCVPRTRQAAGEHCRNIGSEEPRGRPSLSTDSGVHHRVILLYLRAANLHVVILPRRATVALIAAVMHSFNPSIPSTHRPENGNDYCRLFQAGIESTITSEPCHHKLLASRFVCPSYTHLFLHALENLLRQPLDRY